MLRRRFLEYSAAISLLGAAPWSAAMAQGDPANMGTAAPNLLLGKNDPWTGAVDGGFYTLTNTAKAGAIYVILANSPGPKRMTSVSIDTHPIGAQTTEFPGSGLVLNYNAQANSFYLATLDPLGEVSLWANGGDGVDYLTSLKATGLRNDVVTRLSAELIPGGVELFTNGNKIGAIEGATLNGRNGIAAIDRGTFYFANFLMS